jgi:hypothetical protein
MMLKSLRNISSFFLLVVFLLPGTAQWHLQQLLHGVQHRMKEKLESAPLITLQVAEKDIRWAKADKEIWVGDQLFDIKTMQKQNGRLLLTGLFDKEEKELKSIQQKTDKQASGLCGFLFRSLQLFYTGETTACLLSSPAYTIPDRHRFVYGEPFYQSPGMDIPLPPPRFAS